jgi:hypothetical protein
MVMEEDHKMSAIIGMIIILVVGINLVLIFTDVFHIGQGVDFITGYTTLECINSAEGLKCGSMVYPYAELGGCKEGTTSVCTTACEISGLMAKDDRVCPTYCTDFCLPNDMVDLLNKEK